MISEGNLGDSPPRKDCKEFIFDAPRKILSTLKRKGKIS